MTAQQQPMWGQAYERQRARSRRSVLDWQAWKPWLLTPRLIAYMNRPRNRSWFVFGGCGFMLFIMFAYVMAVFVITMVVFEWDLAVLIGYALTWCCVRPVRAMRSRRAAA